MLRAIAIVLLMLSFPLSSLKAEVETPRARIERTVHAVREITRAHVHELESPELDRKLRAEAMPIFDFVEMSQRSLGVNWKQGSKEQQKEFVDIFSELLARTYAKRIRESVADSQIKVVDDSIDGDKALVRTIAIVDGDEVKIEYRLSFRKDQWRVYDVIIENIGLVSNYRNEFSGIVRKSGFEGLLVRLREKQAGNEGAATAQTLQE